MLFFDDFYRHLADGKSLGGALADTQREWLKRRPQDPTWSSIMLLGGSAWIPFPGGLPDHAPWWRSPAAAAVAALVLAGGLLLFFRLRGARK